MTLAVAAAVLVAAVLHAVWNALAKAVPDRLVGSALLGAAFVPVAGVGVWFVPAPLPASWPYLVGSAVLQSAYLLLLLNAYRYGEFGKVYPVARGTSPLLVAALSVPLLGDRLTAGQLVGVAVVSSALVGLVFGGGRPPAGSGPGLVLAVATGATIAAYTVIDGTGVRQSGNALSYALWLFLLHGPIVVGVCAVLRGRGLWRGVAGSWPRGLLGGVLSMIAYAIVLWAQTRSPLALVSALRETSVLFAVAIAGLVFAEKITGRAVAATVLAVAGIALMKLS